MVDDSGSQLLRSLYILYCICDLKVVPSLLENMFLYEQK